jgi:PIN domain nuclease of toxin-antitoxin system
MMQPYLLDTCAALWLMADVLPAPALAALAHAHQERSPVYVSPVTAWEIGIMARKGRFRSSYTPQHWFELLVGAPGMAIAEMPAKVLLESQLLPGPINADPADRIIAATAREYGFTVMTRDRALLAYAKEGYLSAVEC